MINQFGDIVACEINARRYIFEITLINEFDFWFQDEQFT